MFVFIAHADADQAAADDLRSFLTSRGLVAETETGASGFRHLKRSDVVIALWSQKATFGAQRMMMERRMLEAWAEGRLVLVKLDHSALPVGLRDLPFVDASYATGRQLSVWPNVERQARSAMDRAMSEAAAGAAAPPPAAPPTGVGPGGSSPEPAVIGEAPGPPEAPSSIETRDVADEVVAAKSKRSSPLLTLMILAAIAALGWAGWRALQQTERSAALTYVAYAVIGLGCLLLLAVIVQAVRPPPRKAGTAAFNEPRIADAPVFRPPAPALFISYAHADNAAVAPLVDAVKADGRNVWIDQAGIQTGEGWAGEIVRAIKSAGAILIMCSKRAFESDHVKRELYLADRYKKPLAPVFLEPAQPPEDFEYFFAGVQWLELYKLPESDRPAAVRKALSTV